MHDKAIGIDIDGNGRTPNDADDADAGPNLRMNHPQLRRVAYAAGQYAITYQSECRLAFMVADSKRRACSLRSPPSPAALRASAPFSAGERRQRLPACRRTQRECLPEPPVDLRDRLDEAVDLVARVVDRERGAQGCGHAVELQQRMRAVVARAHRDALVVEQGSEVVRERAVDQELKHADALLRLADQDRKSVV